MTAQLQQAVACMGAHGIADFPDPSLPGQASLAQPMTRNFRKTRDTGPLLDRNTRRSPRALG
jgi:hypothetical protein